MYIYIYIHMCIRPHHVHINVYILYTHTHTKLLYIYIHIYIHICIQLYVHIYIYTHTRAPACHIRNHLNPGAQAQLVRREDSSYLSSAWLVTSNRSGMLSEALRLAAISRCNEKNTPSTPRLQLEIGPMMIFGNWPGFRHTWKCILIFPNQKLAKATPELNFIQSLARFGTVQLRALYEQDQSRLGSQSQ